MEYFKTQDIFNRCIAVFLNDGRGNARGESLLRSFELEERLIASADEVNAEYLFRKPLISKRGWQIFKTSQFRL